MILLEYGADPLAREGKSGSCALHEACLSTRYEERSVCLTTLLLSHMRAHDRTRLDVRNSDNDTPLGCAFLSDNREAAFALIEAGANPEETADLTPPWAIPFLRQRRNCRRACRVLYGMMRHRLGVCHDMCNLVTCALWQTRRLVQWDRK